MAYGVGGQGKVQPDADRIREERQKDQQDRENERQAKLRAAEKAAAEQKIRNEAAAKQLKAKAEAKRKATAEAERRKEQDQKNRRLLASRLRRQQFMQGTPVSNIIAYIPESLQMIRGGYKKGGPVGYTQRWKNARRKNSKT